VKNFGVGAKVCPDMIVKCGVCKAAAVGAPIAAVAPLSCSFARLRRLCLRPGEERFCPKSQHKLESCIIDGARWPCVTRGQTLLTPYPGELELVVGAGPIGLMHMQVARAFGMPRVIVSDPIPRTPGLRLQEAGAPIGLSTSAATSLPALDQRGLGKLGSRFAS